jgi:hypothetical protein
MKSSRRVTNLSREKFVPREKKRRIVWLMTLKELRKEGFRDYPYSLFFKKSFIFNQNLKTMKKSILRSFLVLLMMFGLNAIAQQNKASNTSTKNQNGFQKAYNNSGFKNSSGAVITTTTSSCMSINYPAPATWSLVNYGTGTVSFASNGFVNGANTYGDKEKAMYFDASASANTMITQIYVGFGIAYSATPSKTVAIKIYDGTSGTPGTALGQGTLSMGTIMNDVNNNQYSLILFGTPVNLPASKKFFVSVDLTGLQWTSTIHDSLSIVSNTSPQTSPTPVWEKWSTNAWYNYSNASSWQLSISLLIHPFLTQAPIVATMSTSGQTICAGQSVSYNSAGSTAGTYEWTFGAIATPTASGATANATYTSAGTYTTYLVVEDACGSLGITSKTIQVKATPTVVATPASTTVCNGANITLSGGGASTYTWTGGISNATPFAATSSNNYTVTGTSANGCTSTAVSAVIVNPNPVVTANTTTNTICSGNNITLTGGGASTYTWSGGVSNGIAFAPASSGAYTVTGTAVNNCTASANVSITVNQTPTVTATPSSTTVCSGTSVSFNGGGATSYSWSGGINDATPFNAATSNAYTVTGTAANGCTNTAVATLSVNATPTLAALASPSLSCSGVNVTLTGSGATTYTWSNGVSNGSSFTPTAASVYTVNGTSSGCTGSATVAVNVGTTPTVTANASASVVCPGSTVVLTGSGASTYSWTGGVINGTAFTPSATANYVVTGFDASGCSNTATTSVTLTNCTGIKNNQQNSVEFTVYPNPAKGEFNITPNRDVSYSIELYDALGKLILAETQLNGAYHASMQLSPGIYFVKVKTSEGSSIQKIIRN